MPELVMQEPDDGIGQTLLVIHLEMGADKVWGFQDLRTAVHSVRTGRAAGTAEPLPLCPHAPTLPCRSHFNSLANCVCLTTVRQTCEFSTFHRGDAEAVGPEPLAILPDSNPRVMWPWARWSSLLTSWTGGVGLPRDTEGRLQPTCCYSMLWTRKRSNSFWAPNTRGTRTAHEGQTGPLSGPEQTEGPEGTDTPSQAASGPPLGSSTTCCIPRPGVTLPRGHW